MDPDFYKKHRLNGRKSWNQLNGDYKRKVRKVYLESLQFKLDTEEHNAESYNTRSIAAHNKENNSLFSTPVCSNNINNEDNNSSSEKLAGDRGNTEVCKSFYNFKNPISSSTTSSLHFNKNSNNDINIDDNKQSDLLAIHECISSTSEVTVSEFENILNESTSSSLHNNSIALENNNKGNDEEKDKIANKNNVNVNTLSKVCKKSTVLCDKELLKLRLAKCIVVNKINAAQSNALLKTLREHPLLQFLPKDSRSLLNTPRDTIQIKEIPPGEYLHVGLKFMINMILRNIPEDQIPTKLIIDFSTDGVELNQETQLWPIQFRIVNLPNTKPDLLGIYKGNSKPSSFEALFSDFVNEVNEIIKDGGIHFNNHQLPIELRCFIADAPARSYVLNHYGHNSEYPCSKCYVTGVTFMGCKRYPGINYKLRNNVDYRLLKDVDHHKGQSALHDLSIDLVEQVSFDYMHLVCLGVVKKTIESTVFGKCNPAKLPTFKMNILSNRLTTLQLYCPREFARIPRELDKLSTFKATEYRQVLLYTFIVVFRGVISDDQYNHFLLLHYAMRILLSDSSSENVNFADECLKRYVLDAEKIHGRQFLTYNSHGLLHLVSDYKLYGPLDSVSAFQYENRMPKYREAVRKPDKPLQQIHKRIYEESYFSDVDEKKIKVFKASNSHNYGPIPKLIEKDSNQYENVQTPTFYFSIQNTDNTVITQDEKIGIIKNIIFYNNEYYFAVYFFTELRSFYTVSNKPSTDFGVYLCGSVDDNQAVIIAYKEIKSKCYRMPLWVNKPFINRNVNDEQLNNVFVVATL